MSALSPHGVRRLLIVGIGLWMVAGPVYRQVLGGQSDFVREWRMYGMRAVEDCQVRYEAQRGGAWVPVSRAALLGWKKRRPSAERSIQSAQDARSRGEALCERAGSQLRYRMRCADGWAGWGPWTQSGDLCGAPKP